MAKPHQNMADYKRRHALALSKAMKAHSEARRCPKCKRAGAMKKIETDHISPPIFVCRWADCGYSS
jgi:hypothetical protein